MEFLALIAIGFAVAAFIQASNAKRRADELQFKLNQTVRRLDDLQSGVAPSQSTPQETETPFTAPAPQRHTAEFTPVKPRPPAEPAPLSPAPATASAKSAGQSKNLEETLTSRWLVWLGAVAIMLAGTFLVRYAIEKGLLGPVARVTLGLILGTSLAATGEWLRRRPIQRAIAAMRTDHVPPALTASGLFIAFASIYAAYALYNLLPPVIAFAGLAVVALVAVALSILQGRFVALMGLLGAFAAPAMVEAKDPSVWTLFGYLIVVEAACLSVARYKSWWWFALATLAGASIWPFLWMLGINWSATDILPLGIYLLLTIGGFLALQRGAPDPQGQEDWVAEVRNFAMPQWVIWIAACAVAFVLFVVVNDSDYSLLGLIFIGLTAALYLYVGRRHAIFDSLPVVAAVLVLAVIATMPVPGAINLVSHRGPLVPAELQYFTGAASAFGVLFALFGFAALWGAKRPALWAGISAAVPILILIIAYYRIVDFGVDHVWSAIAVALALVSLVAAERVERYREARGLEITLAFYAAGVVSLLSLAAAMSVREAWLTVALSVQLPALAWISTRLRTTSLQIIAAVVATVVLTRLVFNYDILSYPLGANPAMNWVVYGYGIPAASFLYAAHLFRRQNAERVIALLEAGGLAFCVLLISLEIRLFVAGSLAAPEYGLLEQSLQSIAWLAVGSALAVHYRQAGRKISFYAAAILLGVAAAQIVLLQLLASNPFVSGAFVGKYPVVNVLFLAYAVPAIFAFRFASAVTGTPYAMLGRCAEIAGFVLVFVYLSFEVTRAFQGPVFNWGQKESAELYAYSVVWLGYAVVLLVLGIFFERPLIRFASLAVLVVTALKVFLVDMSGLTDLYRVASFLGLGLSLVGIGFIYQRFVFPRPVRVPSVEG